MVHRSTRLALTLFTTLALACGDASSDDESGGAGAGTDDGTGPNGSGAGDASPTGSTNGGAGGACVEDPNTCAMECPDGALLDLFPTCPTDVCGQPSRCVDPGLAGISEEQSALLADCPDGSKCVPEEFIATFNKFDLVNCTSVNGFEGRCLSECLPPVAEQIDFLPVDVCQAGERCTPCFDPFTGEPTGACGLSCDDPPSTQPEVNSFKPCCQDKAGGHCLPVALVGQASADILDASECEAMGETGTVCVPDVVYEQVAAQGSFTGAACEVDQLIVFTGTSNEGACLPRCIPEVDAQSKMIELQAEESPFPIDLQSDCPNGFACLPCINQAEYTGACDPQGV